MPTEYNSPIYRGHRPQADAACVALLRRGGLRDPRQDGDHRVRQQPSRARRATRTTRRTRPAAPRAARRRRWPTAWCRSRSARRPAARSSGRRPTAAWSASSRASAASTAPGLKFVSESLDTIGVFGRDIAGTSSLAQHVLTGRALPDQHARASRASACAARRAGATPISDPGESRARGAGAGARPVRASATSSCRPEASALFDRHAAVMGFESAHALAWEYTNFPNQISATLRPRLEAGWRVKREEYDEVRGIARDCRARLAEMLREFDFLLTPSAPGRRAGFARLDRRPGIQPRLDAFRRAVRDAAFRRRAQRPAARRTAGRRLR